jgi:hypothetical protein
MQKWSSKAERFSFGATCTTSVKHRQSEHRLPGHPDRGLRLSNAGPS